MRPATLAATVAALSRDADLELCEGAMGLFDGIDAAGTGSCADLAALTGWPVVLVVDWDPVEPVSSPLGHPVMSSAPSSPTNIREDAVLVTRDSMHIPL